MSVLKASCFVFVILAIATIVSHTGLNQYEQAGPGLLTGDWKFKPSATSRINITENGLTLDSGDAQTVTSVYQDVAVIEHGTVLKLSADIKCDDVVPGKKPWNLARLLLVQNDGRNDRWDLPHTVAALTGTTDWKNHHAVFTVSPDTLKIQVIAQLSQSSGSLQIKNIQLYPVNETLIFRWARGIILFAWGAFFLLLVASCFLLGRKKILFRLLLISAFVAIIAGTTLPGEIKHQVAGKIGAQIDAGNESFKAAILRDSAKVWHFCFFFLLGLILCLTLINVSWIQPLAIIMMLAGGTEIVQLYINGRTALLSDFFIDAAGGITGLILIRLFGMNKNIGRSEMKMGKTTPPL
jgi:hypothetical protein